MPLDRVPVWRAFRQLDALSDGECRDLLWRAEVRFGRARGVISAILIQALVVTVGGLVASGWWEDVLFAHGTPRIFGIGAVLMLTLLSAALLGALWLAIEDALLLRRFIRANRCPRCDYSLCGLKLIDAPGLDPNPAGRKVRCPECGKVWGLLDLGLSPADLLAWESRELPAGVGKMKREQLPRRAVLVDDEP